MPTSHLGPDPIARNARPGLPAARRSNRGKCVIKTRRRVEATGAEPIHLVRFRQSLKGIRRDSEGISEIQSGAQKKRRKKGAESRVQQFLENFLKNCFFEKRPGSAAHA